MCLGWLLAAPGALAQKPADGPEESVRLSLERYGRLMAEARARAGASATWGRGQVVVRVEGEQATVTVEAQVEALGEGEATVSVLPAEAVILLAELDGREARLLPLAGTHGVRLTGGEETRLRLRYRIAVARDAEGASLVVPLPPVPGSAVRLEGISDVSLWPATPEGGGFAAPATPALFLRWGAGPARDAVRRVDYLLTPDAGGDGVDVEARMELVAQGKTTQVRLARADAALMDVRDGREAPPSRVVDGWHTATLRGVGPRSLTVRFRLPIDRSRGQPQVVLHPDQVPIARVELTVPGKREVVFEPAVPRQVTVRGEAERASTTAVAHLPPTEELVLRWTEARAAPESQVRVIVHSYQLLTLKEGFLKGTAHLEYDIANGELRELSAKLPPGVDVYQLTGPGVEDWQVLAATEDAPRQVRVLLGQPTQGKVALKLELERTLGTEAEGTPLELPVLAALKVSRQEGVVALFDGDKTGFAPAEDPEGRFRKVGEDALPAEIRQGLRDKVAQAWKFINDIGPLRSKIAAAEAREVRFDARVDTLYHLREGSLTGHATVLVEIKSGRRDTLHLSLPEGVAEPRITGPSLSKTEPAPDFPAGAGRKAYVARFTQALEGAIQLDVEFEQLLAKDQSALSLPGLRIHEAEVESGSLGLAAETGMEAVVGEARDLRVLATDELPKAVRLRSDGELSFGYGYARAPWSLGLTLKRNRTIETLAAVARQVWLETHALDNGHLVTRATYHIANDARQDVRLVLPERAEVLSVTVDGRRVKAVSDEQTGALAVPIPRQSNAYLQVTYEVVGDRLGGVGRLVLEAPRADVRSSDIQWLLRAPAGLALLRTTTELRPEPDGWRAAPVGLGDQAVDLPTQADMRTTVYSYAVQEPTAAGGAPLSIALWYSSGGTAFEPLALLLALGLLALVTWRRGTGGGSGLGLLAGAVLLLALKATVWGFGVGEAVLAAGVIVAVGLAAWRRRRAGAEA